MGRSDGFLIRVGPGNCTGILAAKTSPTAVRGQYYGFAAAIGKVGAFVGTYCMWKTISVDLMMID